MNEQPTEGSRPKTGLPRPLEWSVALLLFLMLLALALLLPSRLLSSFLEEPASETPQAESRQPAPTYTGGSGRESEDSRCPPKEPRSKKDRCPRDAPPAEDTNSQGGGSPLPRGFFWVLAPIPSILVVGYRLLSRERVAESSREMVRAFREDVQRYESTEGGGAMRQWTTGSAAEIEKEPPIAPFIVNATALFVPFALVAWLQQQLDGAAFQENPGGWAVVFAGYGIYTYTLTTLIFRVYAAALSYEFLLGATLRTLIALVFAYVLGQTGFALSIGAGNEGVTASAIVYFFVGAFPVWAAQTLRRHAHGFFQHPSAKDERLSLELVDGINEKVAERLEELGIVEVQHLAMADPGRLTLRTLYPITRVLDWVDQAWLICKLREHAGLAHQLGIRGATDLSHLYQLAMQEGVGEEPEGSEEGVPPHPSVRARQVFQDLSSRTGLSLSVLYDMAAHFEADVRVRFLHDFWRGRGLRGEPPPTPARRLPRPPRRWFFSSLRPRHG